MIFFRCPLRLRRNQTRGVPALAASIKRFEDLDQTDLAVRTALQVAASQALIITHPNPAGYQGSIPGELVTRTGADALGATRDKEFEIEPGMAHVLPTGADMKQFTPAHPSLVYENFVLMELGQIGADIGAPVLLVLMDPTKTNYSGFRAMLALAFEGFYAWREALESVCRRIYRWKMAGWIRAGLVEFHQGWDACTWVWPPLPQLDPKAEMLAQEIAQRMGVKSDAEITAESTGMDVREVYRKRAEEKRMRVELGIEPAAIAKPNGQADDPESDDDRTDDERKDKAQT